MAGTLRAINSPALIIGGISDHCHILTMQSKNIATCKLIEEVKKSSSKWIKTKGIEFRNFKWQNGYGAFSVSQSQREQLKQYILNQEEHHYQKSFKEEFRTLLKKYDVEYNEKYVWN